MKLGARYFSRRKSTGRLFLHWGFELAQLGFAPHTKIGVCLSGEGQQGSIRSQNSRMSHSKARMKRENQLKEKII